MPQPDTERSLGEAPPPEHDHSGSVFGNPNGATPTAAPTVKYLDLDEVLSSARRHRTAAHICLRADLQAEYDDLLAELAAMVDAQGQLLPRDPEATLDDAGTAALAQEKADRVTAIRREMNAAMRRVEFEGMPEDKWRPWYERHYPQKAITEANLKGLDVNQVLKGFNDLLIAEVAVAPKLTVDEVLKLRSVLGPTQINELANKAWEACTSGGVDIPKSPRFLRNLELG